MRGRIVRAAYCSFCRRREGTITSASTVQNGTRSRAASPPLGPLGAPQRVFVADHQRRPHLVAEPQEVMVGRPAHHEADAAPGEVLGHIAEALAP